MKGTIATALAVLLFHVAAPVAHAEPTEKELKARADELEKKLEGQKYTVLVEAPFVVIGDFGDKNVKKITTGFLRGKVALLEKDFFTKRPDKLLEVWLFANEKSFRAGAKKFFNDTPDTPYGYYSPDANALIMNASGLGTLSHELVHPYMEANFPDVPSWFNEGLASLYEQPSERKGHIVGLPNWRLPNLKKEIKAGTLPKMSKLLGTTRDQFYEANYDSYAYARYIVYYLQEQGKLQDFYKKFLEDKKDLTGATALAAVLGEDLETFEPKWRKWVLNTVKYKGH
ncbi:MAG TPA: hypothetical protein VL326_18585 [Kofleriaceae bacterium]|jgi:hypothetical protein|nr:hypothetical protein [Kofleriaceae bacterium]